MGQTHPTPPKQPITFQLVNQSIKTIFQDQQTKYNPSSITLSIQHILQNLSDNIPAQKTEQGFILNQKMIEIFYHERFMFSMGKMINLLVDRLEEIMQRRLIMVQKEEWMFCLNLANFIVFFTDDKLIKMIETVGVRSDLSQSTKRFIQNLQQQGKQFTATQSLIDKLAFSQIERIQKCLRISLNQMINMRTQVITRSQQTLKVIEKLQQACFILYLKALYSPQHSQSILTKAKHVEFLKSNLTIAHYFLGKGSDLGIASIYQSAVLLTFNLIEKNPHLKQFKSLPTHLFKSLPIISQNTVYDFIMNICLYSLSYVKQNNQFFARFSCNRLMTLKLLDVMIKEVKVSSAQITYYLEEICLQTRIGMIERSFVTDLVQHYVELVRETVEMTEKEQLLKKEKSSHQSSSKIKPKQSEVPLTSKYAKQHHISEILTKYLQSGKQNYNIKYSNKKWKITTVDIITQLENDQNIIQTEFRILCEKYIYEVVLMKKVMYQYNDRQIWSQILPHILEDKLDGSDSGGEGDGDEDMGHERQWQSEIKHETVNKMERQQQLEKQEKHQLQSEIIVAPQRNLQSYHQQQPNLLKVNSASQSIKPVKVEETDHKQKQPQDEQQFQDAVQHEIEEKDN